MRLAFVIVAVVLFVLAALPVPATGRLLPIGLAFFAASTIAPS